MQIKAQSLGVILAVLIVASFYGGFRLGGGMDYNSDKTYQRAYYYMDSFDLYWGTDEPNFRRSFNAINIPDSWFKENITVKQLIRYYRGSGIVGERLAQGYLGEICNAR